MSDRVSGLLLVDKPQGVTSHDVVGRCRRALGRKDVGHAGTLDPMATGLLVVLVGQATKLSDYILSGDKGYEAEFLLGQTTDTDDVTGEVQSENPVPENFVGQLPRAIEKLTGEVELPVPMYSAVKVKGKKLYEKARQGEDFKPPIRPMEFKKVQLLQTSQDRVRVEIACRKGGYIRAWGKALGQDLGCGATMSELRRVTSQPYGLQQAKPLEAVEKLLDQSEQNPAQLSCWVPLGKTLPHWPRVLVDGLDEKLLSNGQISKKLERFLELEFGGRLQGPGIKVVSRRSQRLVAIIEHQPPLSFKIRRVFPGQ